MLAAPLLVAQPQHLTTDSTGSVLYFSSTLTQPGQSSEPHSKLFRWDAGGGIRVFLVRPRLLDSTPPFSFDGWKTNFFEIDSPSLASDGNSLLYVAHQRGGFGYGKGAQPAAEVSVQGADGQVQIRGTIPASYGIDRGKAELSRNGKYISWITGSQAAIMSFDTRVAVYPPASTLNWTAQGPLGLSVSTRQMLSNDGWMIYVEGDSQSLALISANLGKQGQQVKTTLPATVPSMAPIISPSGAIAVFESQSMDGVPRQLYSLDIQSGKQSRLFVDAEPEYFGELDSSLTGYRGLFVGEIPFPEPIFGASIDDAGDRVLILAKEAAGLPRQWLFLIASDASSPQWLAYTPEGYHEAVISGDGKVAFAVTESGRLLRIDLTSLSVQELLPRTPWIDHVTGAWRQGAANKIVGGGFSSKVILPLMYPASNELGGVKVNVNGTEFPVLRILPSEITYQIPWEYQFPDPPPAEFPDLPILSLVPSDSPLVQPPVARNSIGGPQFEFQGAVHSDGVPVDLYRPAQSGETLRFLLTGLAKPKGVTGVPADTNDRSSSGGPTCEFRFPAIGAGTPIELDFFGLRVGSIGLYEIWASVPSLLEFPTKWLKLFCRETETNSVFAIDLPAQP